MDSFGRRGGAEAVGPIASPEQSSRAGMRQQQSPACTAFLLPFFVQKLHIAIYARQQSKWFHAHESVDTFSSLSAFVEPHSISATTAKAGAVSGSAVSVSSCKLQPLHPPPQGLSALSQVGQGGTEPFSCGKAAWHSTAPLKPAFWCLRPWVTLFLSMSKIITSLRVISLYLRLQGFGQGFFLSLPSLQKCVKDIIYYDETVNIQTKSDISSLQIPLCPEDSR